ncbi:MAG: hypothetical protein QW568_03325 [Candidatus Anstonellaceae archaeon]
MGVRVALVVLLFLPSLFAVKEIEEASEHNAGLAASLLGAENACGYEARQPSAEDVFSVADITAVAVIPQAGGITTDVPQPRLLWSYSVDYPEDAVFPVESEGGCPMGRIEIRNPINRKLENGRLAYSYGNRTMQVNLFPNGPNPVLLDLNSSYLEERDYSGLFANLTVNLSGRVSVTYSYEKYWYTYRCETDGEYAGCGCTLRADFGVKEYEKPVFGSRKFLVETGPVEKIWLNPPIGKRLSGKQDAKLLFFARRMPAKITMREDGSELAHAAPYRFRLENGECGEKIVAVEFSPETANSFVNVSNAPEFPKQLVGKNAAYLPIYLEFGMDSSAGRKNLTVEYEDWFLNRMNFSDEILVREPEAFDEISAEEGAVFLRQGDGSRTPAAYPARGEGFAPVPLSSLAAVFAVPFALGAIAIISWLQKIRP